MNFEFIIKIKIIKFDSARLHKIHICNVERYI